MRIVRFLLVAAISTVSAGSVRAASLTYDGITFPDGIRSFADEVVGFNLGSPSPTDPNFTDSSKALGAPDYSGGGRGTGSYSLGNGGSITLRFTDNLLTGSGNAGNDLHIFEVGPDLEDTFVEISRNGTKFFSVGKVSGSTSSIDIDFFGFGKNDRFSYVRLTDDPNEGARTGATVGADIDSVGAISSVVPVPGSGLLIVGAMLSMLLVCRSNNKKSVL